MALLLLFFFIIFFLSLFMLINRKIRVSKKSYKLPPGPKKLPFIGNLHQIAGSSPHKSLHRLSQKHGPLMFLKLGSIPTIIISSAEVMKQVFKNHDRVFSNRPTMYVSETLTYGCVDLGFSHYGDYWREMRKIATLELFSVKRVQMFEAVRLEEVKLLIDSISESCHVGPIDLSQMLKIVANDVISRAAFSKKYGSSEFNTVMKEILVLLGEFNVADTFPRLWWINMFNGFERRLKKSFEILDKLYDKVIEEHLDQDYGVGNDHNEDFLDVLLRVQKDSNQAISINNNHIKAVLTDMFVAGTDTVSVSLEWIIAELVTHPTTMRKAQEEVRTVVNAAKGIVEESDLPQLTYLKAIIKEGLRLHPPLPLLLPRETTEDCTILDYHVPAKTRVIINATSLSVDPQCWEVRPNEFWPERFLNSPVDFKGQHFELVPFGVGRRGCPGMNMGIVFIELVLANLMYSFDWKLPHGMKIEDFDMEEGVGITTHKNVPLRLVAKPANLHVY